MKEAMSAMINEIAKAAETANPPEAGDYINDDGLLVCGKCNTPKQVRITVFDRVFTPYCLCKCAKERLDEEQHEKELEAEYAKIDEMRKAGFPDADMASWTFEKDDGANPKITAIAHRYVDNFETMLEKKKGLLLYGTVGTGKTFIAACIANALIDEAYPCLVTNFSRLANTLFDLKNNKQAYLDELNEYELLVIDDLATERETEYMQEIVTSVIDARYRSGKPLIVTTNLTADELKNAADLRKKRVYSRLLEMCIPIEVTGKDRRKERLKADFGEMKELLGL